MLLLAAAVAAELRLFVFPPADEPVRADAVVVLGGPGDRMGLGWDLAREGLAPAVVVFVPDPRLCEPLAAVPEEICLTPEPPTTRGEARMVAELASERGWDHLVVVTAASQAVRARIRLERCFDGRLELVTVREDGLAQQLYRVFYENGAMIKALAFERDC
ncbi:YdcF family protein [Jiangella rhizosphaerae]|uniref:YdcF family protein n=1 Tax=Jiangella rhizosphaerae TaxID=2293569 RepID=A0A418KRN9_9ACTN|nr:YdcF family protein [Jiangella rhizosphaerae]